MEYEKKGKRIEAVNNYGATVNYLVGAVGIILILVGVVLQVCFQSGVIGIFAALLYSVGASTVSSAIVTAISFQYMMETRESARLSTEWRLHSIYETKANMNTHDADEALRNCKKSIDIIAEGMSNYISSQGNTLVAALDRNVKIRIISCDSKEMLIKRERDETLYGQCDGNNSVQKVIDMVSWVERLKEEDKNRNIEVRFHSSYPGFSYLKLDNICFVSANLWRKQSQQSFAVSFSGSGKGIEYFSQYFDELWESSFVHSNCLLLNDGNEGNQ